MIHVLDPSIAEAGAEESLRIQGQSSLQKTMFQKRGIKTHEVTHSLYSSFVVTQPSWILYVLLLKSNSL